MQNTPDSAQDHSQHPDNPLNNVPIEISVCVGKARPLVKELLTLDRDSVLLLDKHIEDPVELYVGDRLIAVGLLEIDENTDGKQLAVRLTQVTGLGPLS